MAGTRHGREGSGKPAGQEATAVGERGGSVGLGQESMTMGPDDLPVGEILTLARAHGAGEVRVFGSWARGEASTESDLDLLVRLEPGRSLLDPIGLEQGLEDRLGLSV